MFHRTHEHDGVEGGSTDTFATVDCEPHFAHPIGFIRLRERHRVKAGYFKSVTNAQDRHCRIRKVKLK